MTRSRALIEQPGSVWRSIRASAANWFYGIGRSIYPFTDRTPDDVDTFYWEMSATFTGTEKEADEIFDRMTSLTCQDCRPLHDCLFVVGGMTRHTADDSKDED